MEILLAKDMGFCWGVRRAIDIMEQAADQYGEIISVGPIVHNPQVVSELEAKGVRTGKPETSSTPVAITAHGVGPQVLEEVRATGAEVIDGTCPIVTRSQRWAKRMAEQGFNVLVFGDPDHREVRGVIAWAGDKAIPIRDGQPLPDPFPNRVALISQTTQTPERFAEFVAQVMTEHVIRWKARYESALEEFGVTATGGKSITREQFEAEKGTLRQEIIDTVAAMKPRAASELPPIRE